MRNSAVPLCFRRTQVRGHHLHIVQPHSVNSDISTQYMTKVYSDSITYSFRGVKAKRLVINPDDLARILRVYLLPFPSRLEQGVNKRSPVLEVYLSLKLSNQG